jgi:hypothetical protein
MDKDTEYLHVMAQDQMGDMGEGVTEEAVLATAQPEQVSVQQKSDWRTNSSNFWSAQG